MTPALRVLMTADAVGGVWTYALDLARSLVPHGVEIALATMGRLPSQIQCAEAASIPNVTLFPSEFALEWMPDPWDDVARAGEWLLQIAAQWQPNIVHLNGYAHGGLPWNAPTLIVSHSCVLSWWQAVHSEAAPAEWERYRAKVRAGLHAADLVAAPTHAMLDALQAQYGPLASTCVLPNGREAAGFKPGHKQPFIFSAGRLWDDAKNIRALAQIAPSLPWPVIVAGETARPGGQDTHFEGVCQLGCLSALEIAARLASASIYALPARYEPFGLSALEAGLSACALVLGDIPSLREVWGDAALYAAPDNPEALRQAVCRLIDDPALSREMAARALARAQAYTPKRMAAAYLSVYQTLVGNAP